MPKMKSWFKETCVAIGVGVFAVIIILIIASFFYSESGQKGSTYEEKTYPDLEVDSEFESSLSLTNGVYAEVTGQVYNSGTATAENVAVECYVERNRRILGTWDTYLGDLSPNSRRSFSMEINYDGFDEALGYCKADCDNC